MTLVWRGPRGAAVTYLSDLRALEPSFFSYLGDGSALTAPVVIRHDGIPAGVYEDRQGVGVFAMLTGDKFKSKLVLDDARLAAGCWTSDRNGEHAWVAGVAKGEVVIQRVSEKELEAPGALKAESSPVAIAAPSGIAELVLHVVSDTVLVLMLAGSRLEVVPIDLEGNIAPRVTHALRRDASELSTFASASRVGVAVAFENDAEMDFGVIDARGKAATRIHPTLRSPAGTPLVGPRCFWMTTNFVACAKEAKAMAPVCSRADITHFFDPLAGNDEMPNFTFYGERLIGGHISHAPGKHGATKAVAEMLTSNSELQTPRSIPVEYQYLLADSILELRQTLDELTQFLSSRRLVQEARAGTLGDTFTEASFSLDVDGSEAVYRGQARSDVRLAFRVRFNLVDVTHTQADEAAAPSETSVRNAELENSSVRTRLEFGEGAVPPTFWARFLGWVRERLGRTSEAEAEATALAAARVVFGNDVFGEATSDDVPRDDAGAAASIQNERDLDDSAPSLTLPGGAMLGDCQRLLGYERYEWTSEAPPTADELARIVLRAAKAHLERIRQAETQSQRALPKGGD